MSFYSLSDSTFTRYYQDEVKIIFSGIDCVLYGEKAIYCSSEITTGFALYETLRSRGFHHAEELRRQLGDDWLKLHVTDANVQAGIAFADAVREGRRDRTIVITPTPFSAPEWSQAEYLAFWETMLRTRIQSVWFNKNWQYSNGCSFEFAVAQDAGLPTFDCKGNPLDRRAGIDLLQAAIERLKRDGFGALTLCDNLERLTGVVSRAS